MKRKPVLLLSCILLLVSSPLIFADHKTKFTIGGADSVDEAVMEIKETLLEQGFEITAIINHAQNAANRVPGGSA